MKSRKIYIILFLILYAFVAIVSGIHGFAFFGLANTSILASMLAVAFEVGQAVVLFSILTDTRQRKKIMPWVLMSILTLVQVMGNVYNCYKYLITHATDNLQFFKEPIFIWTDLPDAEANVILSYIQGAILPICALLLTSMVASFIHKDEEEVEYDDEPDEEDEDNTPEEVEETPDDNDDKENEYVNNLLETVETPEKEEDEDFEEDEPSEEALTKFEEIKKEREEKSNPIPEEEEEKIEEQPQVAEVEENPVEEEVPIDDIKEKEDEYIENIPEENLNSQEDEQPVEEEIKENPIEEIIEEKPIVETPIPAPRMKDSHFLNLKGN